MKKQHFLSLLLFLLTYFTTDQFLLAQKDTVNYYYEYDTIIVERKIKKLRFSEYKRADMDFYLSPLALFEPCPTIYFGTEYFLKDKLSIYTDIGYIFNLTGSQSDNNRNLYSSYPSYAIKPEIRLYTKSNPQKASYHAIKLMFRNVNYKENQFVYEEYLFDENTQSWSVFGEGMETDYRVRRRSVGLQYIKGWKGRFAKTWISNFYFGVGFRYIANTPIDKRPTPFELNDWGLFNLEYLELEKKYKFMMIDVACGFRIGSKLKKR
ncbi:hypothetical protein [Bernardetia sp.]|uniref:hypothetical protein n=1 Tax=Bernardetia sp. TaxID=1937974 RepID=UPI0025BA6922|nr:hypothetical protein [Bernardetia sp.]